MNLDIMNKQMGADNYYILKVDGRKEGPFDILSLQTLARDGRLTTDTPLESVAFGKIVNASSVQGVFALAKLSSSRTSTLGDSIPINSHLIGAILVTCFCFMPVGAVAIAYAVASEMASRKHDNVEARHAADEALKWIMVAVVIGVAIVLIGITVYLNKIGFHR